MGRGGARAWFTGRARKRAARARGDRALQGDHIQWFAFWGLANCSERAEEKPRVAIDALRRGGGPTVGGQFIVPRLAGLPCSAHQSKRPALLKSSSLRPVLKHGSRSLAV